jgi:hypothetical protein
VTVTVIIIIIVVVVVIVVNAIVSGCATGDDGWQTLPHPRVKHCQLYTRWTFVVDND